MTPDGDAPRQLDDRLAAVRDAVISSGERVVAQEEGDPGQAIVLTDSRVLIIRVGFAATGVADGRIIGDFPLSGVESVTLRKGLVGAVIHVVTAEKRSSAPGSYPDNVIVFTGPARVARCQSMAARIESVLGKPVHRVEPELLGPDEHETQPAEPPEPAEPVAQVDARERVEAVEQAEAGERVQEQPEAETEAFAPNPNLPKPASRGTGPLKKALVLFGLLMAAVIVCVGTTAPLRKPAEKPMVAVDVRTLTDSPSVLAKRRAALASYRTQLDHHLRPCMKAVSALAAAVRSGDRAAMRAALCEDIAERCWRKISQVEPPPGLSASKESIVSGCFELKIAAAGIASAVRSSEASVPARLVTRLVRGQQRIDTALGQIDKMCAHLDRQTDGS